MTFCGLIPHYLAQLVLMAKQLAPVQRYPQNPPVFQSSQVVEWARFCLLAVCSKTCVCVVVCMSAPPNCRLRWILLKHSKWWILLLTTWKIIANSTNRLAQPSTKAPTKTIGQRIIFQRWRNPLNNTCEATKTSTNKNRPHCSDGCTSPTWVRWDLHSLQLPTMAMMGT